LLGLVPGAWNVGLTLYDAFALRSLRAGTLESLELSVRCDFACACTELDRFVALRELVLTRTPIRGKCCLLVDTLCRLCELYIEDCDMGSEDLLMVLAALERSPHLERVRIRRCLSLDDPLVQRHLDDFFEFTGVSVDAR